MFANLNPLGFLAAAKAQDAELLIGETQQLVTALGPTDADLKPAQEALGAAKTLYDAQDYSRALAQAKRAAALAMSLNDRFNAYMATWKELQGCRAQLEELGLPTDGIEAALSAADREVARRVEEGDTTVPNYVGATDRLDLAIQEAWALMTCAREASREIFLATLALEALSDSASTEISSWLTLRLEEMLEHAGRELALGNLAAAHRLGSEVRLRSEVAMSGAARASEILDLAAGMLDGLGASGRVADALGEKIASARGALACGLPDRVSALAVARRLSEEVAAFSKRYPQARRILERAERVYARLQESGFCSYAVDAALSEARRALEAGDWIAVREKVRRASQAFVQLRSEQEDLTRAIAEIDERVALLDGFHLPLLPDVREILGRAKDEVRSGRISGASEDVMLARALMTEATRSGS